VVLSYAIIYIIHFEMSYIKIKVSEQNIYVSNVIHQYISVLMHLCINLLVYYCINALVHQYMNVLKDLWVIPIV
jgi:hypothetical protein